MNYLRKKYPGVCSVVVGMREQRGIKAEDGLERLTAVEFLRELV